YSTAHTFPTRRSSDLGINTALLGHASGAEGISFAIPVHTARHVLKEIIDSGHVVRSWLGISYTHVPVPANSGLPAAARGVTVTRSEEHTSELQSRFDL